MSPYLQIFHHIGHPSPRAGIITQTSVNITRYLYYNTCRGGMPRWGSCPSWPSWGTTRPGRAASTTPAAAPSSTADTYSPPHTASTRSQSCKLDQDQTRFSELDFVPSARLCDTHTGEQMTNRWEISRQSLGRKICHAHLSNNS